MKFCTKCCEFNILDNFHKNAGKSDGLMGWCKDCARKKDTSYQINNPRKKKNSRLKRLYGITIEMYELMLDRQQGKCAICKRHKNEFIKDLFVDHNHITGKVRGLLCSGCNHSIGLLKIDLGKTFIVNALEYHDNHSRS